MIGKYRLKKDVRVRTGVTVFTITKNAEIEVTQQDKTNHKVLIDFGSRDIDWFHNSWLSKYAEKIIVNT